MACIASQCSAFAVRAQMDASVTMSASNARTVFAPARKSFKGVALAKGSFKSQKLAMSRRTTMPVVVSSAKVETEVGTTYACEFPKPVKAKFARGNDGGAYVIQVPNDPLYEELEVGDKIVQIR